MIRRIVCGVAVVALLPVLAGCGRGHAILEAAEKGATKTVERLLKLAVGGGHTRVVALLLEAGAPLEDRDRDIRDAAAGRHIDIVELLLAHGADVNALLALPPAMLFLEEGRK